MEITNRKTKRRKTIMRGIIFFVILSCCFYSEAYETQTDRLTLHDATYSNSTPTVRTWCGQAGKSQTYALDFSTSHSGHAGVLGWERVPGAGEAWRTTVDVEVSVSGLTGSGHDGSGAGGYSLAKSYKFVVNSNQCQEYYIDNTGKLVITRPWYIESYAAEPPELGGETQSFIPCNHPVP